MNGQKMIFSFRGESFWQKFLDISMKTEINYRTATWTVGLNKAEKDKYVKWYCLVGKFIQFKGNRNVLI